MRVRPPVEERLARRSPLPSRWTILGDAGRSAARAVLVHARCSCGTERTIARSAIISGSSKSCGCLSREVTASLAKHRETGKSGKHGSLYSIWVGLICRCYGKHASFPKYGGRGITICDRWRFDFLAFKADMGPRPAGTSLDRRDNNGPYSPENCRWATRAEQARNTSRNVWLELNGERLCISDWAKKIGMNAMSLKKRLANGWSVVDALTKPKKHRHADQPRSLAHLGGRS